MSREAVLQRVRTALGRVPGQAPPPPPVPLFSTRTLDAESKVTSFIQRFEALAGKAVRVRDVKAAGEWVESFLSGRTAVASNAPYLVECGVTVLHGVRTGFTDPAALKAACAEANVGISIADYALAATGTMVMLASPINPRLISLLPPVHVAIFPESSLLTGLDELYMRVPKPADQTSSMVFITGPSRTADIEQILVRGVHGPGEVYAILVAS